MNHSELRITDTNSVNDSKGHALGLDGNDFLYVVGGIIGAIGAFLVLYSILAVALFTSAVISAIIAIGPSLWVLFFCRNRPDGFAGDFFDHLIHREGWSFAPGNQPAFPLFADAADDAASTAAASSAAAGNSPATFTSSPTSQK